MKPLKKYLGGSLLTGMMAIFLAVPLRASDSFAKQQLREYLSALPDSQSTILIDDMRLKVEYLKQFAKPNAGVWIADPPWTDAKVYYVFDPGIPPEGQEKFLHAFREWEKGTPLQFIPRTDQPNYLYIEYASISSSNVGMGGGRQDLWVTSYDRLGTILHELGHALGLHHEHQRSDRDLYIDVFPENAVAWYRNFIEMKLPTLNYSAYDFYSIMHYGRMTLSANMQETIRPKDQYYQYLYIIGQRDSVSSRDREGLRKFYSLMPYLSSPAEGERDVTVFNTPLRFSTFPKALEYQVQVSRDSAFAHLEAEQFLPNIDETVNAIEYQTAYIQGLDTAAKYFWRARCRTAAGYRAWSDVGRFTTVRRRKPVYTAYRDTTVSAVTLQPNYPNPFNTETNMVFDLPEAGPASLAVYNAAGQKLATFLSGNLAAGRYTVNWDAGRYGSGFFFCVLHYRGRSLVRRMLLVK